MKAARKTNSYFVTQFIPIFLANSAMTWLEHLHDGDIIGWYDLQKFFINHFDGAYTKVGSTWELMSCVRIQGESLRDFVKSFTRKKSDLQNIPNTEVIDAFIRDVWDEILV